MVLMYSHAKVQGPRSDAQKVEIIQTDGWVDRSNCITPLAYEIGIYGGRNALYQLPTSNSKYRTYAIYIAHQSQQIIRVYMRDLLDGNVKGA